MRRSSASPCGSLGFSSANTGFWGQAFFWPRNLPQERYNSIEPVPKKGDSSEKLSGAAPSIVVLDHPPVLCLATRRFGGSRPRSQCEGNRSRVSPDELR